MKDDPTAAARMDAPALDLLLVLLDEFHRQNIRYCYWKSSRRVRDVLAGEILDPASEAVLLMVRACLDLRRTDPMALRSWRATQRKFVLDRAELAARIRSAYAEPWNPNVSAMTKPRIKGLFPSFRLELEPLSVLPPVAYRLEQLTGPAYPLLASIPVLRSHYLGLLRQ